MYLTWLRTCIFQIWSEYVGSCRDDMILKRSGRDAIQYLKFQRYLMVYMAIITVFSIGVILPCNFQGDALGCVYITPIVVLNMLQVTCAFAGGSPSEFGHTTISNVSSGWVFFDSTPSAVYCLQFVSINAGTAFCGCTARSPCCTLSLRWRSCATSPSVCATKWATSRFEAAAHYFGNNFSSIFLCRGCEIREFLQVSKTLMIVNIPRDKCYKNMMVQHFQWVSNMYKLCTLVDIYGRILLFVLEKPIQSTRSSTCSSRTTFPSWKSWTARG